jgi:hypothetical protein
MQEVDAAMLPRDILSQSSLNELSRSMEHMIRYGDLIESNSGLLEGLQDYFQTLEQRLIALETLYQSQISQ